ncbi:alpha/beta hydrolase [Kaistia dalseonensis]|uniref:Pimeloyl-ACP methyl ester carboxylesterase n=1 Tax=Kaistia dalseonensis TaxID=410840 RepID=A0ABU0H2L2_9HYPH|nr:alpha/beta hydrolase [Kaistia dalseonensis]MCX5493456.1 alpha/beta hydrolase [Kaistia dalseonensis]MDQ0436015.1 pimeloyl-ACP methyl ester carboxylesterase [Kaistia dalseonensis]
MAAFGVFATEIGFVGAAQLTPGALPRPDKAGFAKVNGIRMWFAIYNPHGGNPVLLLHGGLGSSHDWRKQIPALMSSHEVIIADSRGQGRSTRSKATIGYDLMASDVLALLDHLGLKKVSIVGWSDGGIIGLDIAIHHPERLEKLFAYGANYNVAGLAPSPPWEPHPSPDDPVDDLDDHDRTVHDVMAMWYSEPDFQPDELGRITTPTVIADGEHDQAILPEHTRNLARLIPGAKLVILPKVGHAGLLEDPAAFNKVMMDFLNAGG